MEKRARLDIPWLLVIGLTIPLVIAFAALAPIWHCPGCDRHAGYTNLEGEELQVLWDDGIPDRCTQCGHTGRMTLARRWQLREQARQNSISFPLFR